MKIEAFTTDELSKLDNLKQNLKGKRSSLLEAIGVYMVESAVRNFESQGRPEKWEENAPATKRQKTGSMVLHESGMLKAGIMSWVDRNAAIIGPSGPSIPYSRIQQKGGNAGRGRKVTIPARPYLVLHDEDSIYIKSLIRSELLNA
jgi:phage virion morphogenesis protein